MPFDSSEASPAIGTAYACSKCSQHFPRKRMNQTYCSRECQKNAARGPRDVENSPEARQRCTRHWERARWLCNVLYSTRPQDRIAYVASLVEIARTADAELRNILTDPRLLGATFKDDPGRPKKLRDWTIMNISKAANAWCRKAYGCGVAKVVHSPVRMMEVLPEGISEDPSLPAVLFYHKGGQKPPPMPDFWDFRSLLRRNNPPPH
ncbi:MAG: hypothetical protein Q7J57_05235 [Gemmobacter sp.]|nr:hypothetical protein [Gemmobacter sp.]